jgi:hypothetical protein
MSYKSNTPGVFQRPRTVRNHGFCLNEETMEGLATLSQERRMSMSGVIRDLVQQAMLKRKA